MIVGVPKEIKDHEYRVALTPQGAATLCGQGHQVLVQGGAGVTGGFPDEEYEAGGAELAERPEDVFGRAELVVKVKEPLESEYRFLRPGLVLFTYLHLAALPQLAKVLLEQRVTGIAYETVQLPDGSLPLLVPMSEVGRVACPSRSAPTTSRDRRAAAGSFCRECPVCPQRRSWYWERALSARTLPPSPWAWARASRCWAGTWRSSVS